MQKNGYNIIGLKCITPNKKHPVKYSLAGCCDLNPLLLRASLGVKLSLEIILS